MFGVPSIELAWLAAALLVAGGITGLLAGVFGVGGGAVVVPVLYELFRLLGVPEEVRMPLCVGRSPAVIIPTSIRSFNAHRAKGAVYSLRAGSAECRHRPRRSPRAAVEGAVRRAELQKRRQAAAVAGGKRPATQ